MPLFKKENDYYNSYTDDAAYFQEIGAYTIEDYKRDTEREIALLKKKLEENDKMLQEELKKSQEEMKTTYQNIYNKFGSIEGVADCLKVSLDHVKKILNLK